MGWYTVGPGGLEYKYGDVAGAARSSGLGTLCAVPRLVELADTDYPDLEFLGLLQAAIEKAGLPWRHIEFDLDADVSSESIRVRNDFDPKDLLGELAMLVTEHVDSICEAVGVRRQDLSTLTVSFDCVWEVPPEQFPALIEWLNAPLGAAAPISMARLREGEQDELGWREYQPPETLMGTFKRFRQEDRARDLAACALGAVALTGEDFVLDQPDEVHTLLAWKRELEENKVGVVLYRPAEHPFLDLLAQAFGVSPSVREHIFYVHGTHPVQLPPESDTSAEDLRTGMLYAKYTAGVLNTLAGERLTALQDGGHRLLFGWHAGGALDELAQAFSDAGVTVYSLDELLADHRESWHDISWQQRLASLASIDRSSFVADYVLHGEVEMSPPIPAMQVAMLLVLIAQLDIPDAQRERLALVLRSAAHDASQE